jgi:hypothetical protein
MKSKSLAILLSCGAMIGLVVGLGACHVPGSPVSSVAPIDDTDEIWAQHPPSHGQDPNAPVTPGKVRTVDEPLRSIDGAPAGRVWLLEMYQKALSEKDEITRRAADTARDRDAAVARAAEAEKARADLEARNSGLATENKDLRAKALELARRLADSELARLEAEKVALEGRSVGTGTEKP